MPETHGRPQTPGPLLLRWYTGLSVRMKVLVPVLALFAGGWLVVALVLGASLEHQIRSETRDGLRDLASVTARDLRNQTLLLGQQEALAYPRGHVLYTSALMQVSKNEAQRRYPADDAPEGRSTLGDRPQASLPTAEEAAAARADKELLRLHAEYCKVVANEHRLAILYALAEGERSVGELAAEFDLTMANASQHLRVMKASGLVKSRRAGRTVFYSVANPKLVAACHLIREALVEQHLINEAIIRGEEGSEDPDRRPTPDRP